jgi:SAM-dependent methyltransferase
MADHAIKSMKLYSAVDRVHADLAEAGFGRTDALSVQGLSAFDQLHYHGTDSVDAACQAIGISEKSRVLDVGSGFGGPARWIAHTTGAHVTAVELQADMNAEAQDLTARCGLPRRVRHVQGDILKTPLESDAYDAAVSWLALYHIPDRAPLFPKLADALTPGGGLYVEDLYKIGDFTPAEQQDLDVMLFANTLPTRDGYIAELHGAGFRDIDFKDMTEDWKVFTNNRLDAFRASRERHVRVYGIAAYDALEEFYATMVRMFEGGNLGGVRLIAGKP